MGSLEGDEISNGYDFQIHSKHCCESRQIRKRAE